MKRNILIKILIIVIFAIGLGFLDLPSEYQQKVIPNLPQSLKEMKYNLGLDLQGGTQLTYKIDLNKVDPSQRQKIIEGVKEVITKRVNGLGVNEPYIYVSDFGGEKYIVVELAGIKDIEKAKATVGKVIQLEFKTQKNTSDASEIEVVRVAANDTLKKIKNGTAISQIGPELQSANPQKVQYIENKDYVYQDQLVPTIQNVLAKLPVGKIFSEIVEGNNGKFLDSSGLKDQTGFFVLQLVDKKTQDREIKHDKSIKVSHLLISYKGAERAALTVTRSKEEAQKLAKEVLTKLQAGEDFSTLVNEYSDDLSNKDKGGILDQEVNKDSQYDPDFIAGALDLQNNNEISQKPVETKFGFHLIKADKVTPEYTETKSEEAYKLQEIFFSTLPDPWQDTELNGEYFESASVAFNNLYVPYVSIKFNDEGAKIFEKLTEENINKPLAIFVGGELISAPNVQQKISGGQAQITGNFSVDEANKLARDLMTGAIPAPITLSGQYTLGASIGEQALNASFKAGLIGIIVLALFMILYYRLPGLIANIALTIYAIILAFLIKMSIPMIASTLIAAVIYVFIIIKIVQSEENGLEKLASFVIATFAFFFLAFLFSTSITLTLAGFAGIVLSVGMAVDANILIFERMKEEMRNGSTYSMAIVAGFNRAWPSIRDSNFTTLIICAILIVFGSSIIRGFAFNLAAGVVVSMFTAISISYVFLQGLKYTPLKEYPWLFGGPRAGKEYKKPDLKIMKYRKFFYGLSVASILPGLIGLAIWGFNYGMDFKGGTLLEIKFPNTVTNIQIQEELKKFDDEYNKDLSDETKKIDLSVNPQIIASGENTFIIRHKSIEEEVHQKLLTKLKTDFGTIEELRFTTIGPTVGATLKKKALTSLTIALIAIMSYIAFAFRKVPKQISAWKFGIAAIIALAHDLACLVGIYVIIGHFLPAAEIDTLFITALLTLAGFSVHDTIVVFDRLRENLKIHKTSTDLLALTDTSINETLHRSINTSLSTVIPLIAMYFLGSDSIQFFVLSLIIGITVGAYSSIFIASPLLIEFERFKRK